VELLTVVGVPARGADETGSLCPELVTMPGALVRTPDGAITLCPVLGVENRDVLEDTGSRCEVAIILGEKTLTAAGDVPVPVTVTGVRVRSVPGVPILGADVTATPGELILTPVLGVQTRTVPEGLASLCPEATTVLGEEVLIPAEVVVLGRPALGVPVLVTKVGVLVLMVVGLVNL